MAEKKTRKRTRKTTEKVAEVNVEQKEPITTVLDGEVIGAKDYDSEPVKNDTVVVCSNWPMNHVFEVLDNRGMVQKIVIKGNGTHLKGLASGILAVGAYGITTNVPKEAWEQIKVRYQDDPRIKNGLIFASTHSKARKEAAERSELRNGLEPIDPKETNRTKPNE